MRELANICGYSIQVGTGEDAGNLVVYHGVDRDVLTSKEAREVGSFFISTPPDRPCPPGKPFDAFRHFGPPFARVYLGTVLVSWVVAKETVLAFSEAK